MGRGSNLSSAENLLITGDFKSCANICWLYFVNKRPSTYSYNDNEDLYPAFVFGADQPQDPGEAFLLGNIYLQCIYESGESDVSSGLSAFEAYLGANTPVPFAIGLLWTSLKVHLNQLNQAKSMLEHYLGACAQLVNDGADPTTELCAQYTALADLYAVHVLPRLGMVSTAQSFVDVANNNVLMSTSSRVRMLKEIGDAQARERRKAEGTTANANNANSNASAGTSAAVRAAQAEKLASASTNEQGAVSASVESKSEVGSDAAPGGASRAKGDFPSSIAWEQPLMLVTGAVALGLAVTQRQRIRSGLSVAVQAVGDLMFGA